MTTIINSRSPPTAAAIIGKFILNLCVPVPAGITPPTVGGRIVNLEVELVAGLTVDEGVMVRVASGRECVVISTVTEGVVESVVGVTA